MVVDCGHAGTVMRFLTAFLTQYQGKWLLTGSNRMQQRPIGELVQVLRAMGADIKYIKNEGTPPLLIKGKRLTGGTFDMNPSVSSQFISALMLIAPRLKEGLKLKFDKRPVSFSYIEMTASLMKQMDVHVEIEPEQINISASRYKLKPLAVEPDWSSAAFWYELVALTGSTVTFPGLTAGSLQGDKALVEVFKMLGVTSRENSEGITVSKTNNPAPKIDFDYTGCPDIVPAVMATCSALGTEAIFRGIEHLRYKESDRIEKMERELAKTGTRIHAGKNMYKLLPGKKPEKEPFFETHNDHRLAMALAPLAARFGKVHISDPDVVIKSYPAFWNQLKKTGMFTLSEQQV